MKNEIDIQWVLRVVNKINAEGEKLDGGYKLNGLTVTSDLEGYNISIEDGRCSLHIGFHNVYDFDYPDASAMENFMARMRQVASSTAD